MGGGAAGALPAVLPEVARVPDGQPLDRALDARAGAADAAAKASSPGSSSARDGGVDEDSLLVIALALRRDRCAFFVKSGERNGRGGRRVRDRAGGAGDLLRSVGAWDELVYCNFTFNGNLALTRQHLWIGRAIFPSRSAALLWAAWRFRERRERVALLFRGRHGRLHGHAGGVLDPDLAARFPAADAARGDLRCGALTRCAAGGRVRRSPRSSRARSGTTPIASRTGPRGTTR